jgi:hypothetical protein
MTDLITLDFDGIAIRQVHPQLFCINDLHRAAGAQKKDQPSDWLRLEQTKALIDECARQSARDQKPGTEQIQPVRVVQGGDPAAQGTYVIRELVYAYAMWISPAFHLRAIRFLDAALTGGLATQADPLCQHQLALTQQALREASPTLDVILRGAQAGMTNAQISRAAKVSRRGVERAKAMLRRLGMLPPVAQQEPTRQMDLFAIPEVLA